MGIVSSNTVDVTELFVVLAQVKQLPDSSGAREVVNEVYAKLHALIPTVVEQDIVALADVATEDKNSLSDTERAELFAGLRATLAMKENCEGAPAIGVIEDALMKNPRMMFNLKRLQDAGAKLVVTGFQEGQYVEFADAAQNLDIQKQEAGLAGLTEQERNDAIETIVQPLPKEQKTVARTWMQSSLNRSEDARGLNYAEALLYAVARGGTLISHKAYHAMAKRDSSVYENATWTWYLSELLKVVESGRAPFGYRGRGEADLFEGVAKRRYGALAARVVGLRVPLTA